MQALPVENVVLIVAMLYATLTSFVVLIQATLDELLNVSTLWSVDAHRDIHRLTLLAENRRARMRYQQRDSILYATLNLERAKALAKIETLQRTVSPNAIREVGK